MVFINGNSNFTILSTIARLSGGRYEPIEERTRQWRKKGPFNRIEEQKFLEDYLTPLLLCGKPPSIEEERWFLKCLSNDQTAFTGFTSLVDIVDDERIGYEGKIKLLPQASFVEPFVLRNLSSVDRQKLISLNEQVRALDSTAVEEINAILQQAEQLAPVTEKRKKGKAPLFFYAVTDTPFLLPTSLYQRMEKAAQLVGEGISEVASRFTGSLEKALGEEKGPELKRQLYTGSIDFMIYDDEIYIIDIGAPAIGYIADIIFAAEALGRKPEVGLNILVTAVGEKAMVYQGKAAELGFFALENSVLREGLSSGGVEVSSAEGNTYEINLNEVNYPTRNFDYLSRNQPLRNQILKAMKIQLEEQRARVPRGIITIPEAGDLPGFYERNRKGPDYGIVVKKKVFFREYKTRSGYYKPLVVPGWSREFRSDAATSTLFEEFIPSLIDVDVDGDRAGKRCFEIRMYFCQGEGP